MFYKLVVLYLFVCINNNVCAGTIHSLIFADTNDGSIGDGSSIDVNNLRKFAFRLSQAVDFELKEYNFSGIDFNNVKFDSLQAFIKSEQNDIIIFYISSHGGRGLADSDKFPRIKVGNNYRTVSDKYNLLRQLPHKSLLTIIDACNNVVEVSPIEVQLFSKAYRPRLDDSVSPLEKLNCRKIFLYNPFEVIITSSQPGVESISTPRGSIFTNSFLASSYYYFTNESELANISNIISRAKELTMNESQRLVLNDAQKREKGQKAHYPEWDINTAQKPERLDIPAGSFEIIYKATKRFFLTRWFRKNDYKIVLKVHAAPELMNEIVRVRYVFHHTFPNPVDEAVDRRNDFKYTLFVYGEFLVRAEITLRQGKYYDVAKELKFIEK